MRSRPMLDNIDPGQGGSAMVIPEYPPWNQNLVPEVFPCKNCLAIFDTYNEWFEHRFHMHPIPKPFLVVGDVEIITPRYIVMKVVPIDQIRVVNTQSCIVNGNNTSLEKLASLLTNTENSFFEVKLFNEDGRVESKYEISIEIPNDEHLRWVEHNFMILAASGSLSVYVINVFIQSTINATSAKHYAAGLANYLFGLLGKDQRGNTSLTQEQGREKLNEAHQSLMLIDSPLANMVCAIIEFQSNAFYRARSLQSMPRLNHVLNWFYSARMGQLILPDNLYEFDVVTIIKVPLDVVTTEVFEWFSYSKEELIKMRRYIEKRTKQPDWLPEDRIKARVLLIAILTALGEKVAAIQLARSLRHDTVFQELAEQLINFNQSDL